MPISWSISGFPSIAANLHASQVASLRRKVKHVVEAEAQYEYVTGINQFEQNQSTIDGTDLVADTNQITLGLNQPNLQKRQKRR